MAGRCGPAGLARSGRPCGPSATRGPPCPASSPAPAMFNTACPGLFGSPAEFRKKWVGWGLGGVQGVAAEAGYLRASSSCTVPAAVPAAPCARPPSPAPSPALPHPYAPPATSTPSWRGATPTPPTSSWRRRGGRAGAFSLLLGAAAGARGRAPLRGGCLGQARGMRSFAQAPVLPALTASLLAHARVASLPSPPASRARRRSSSWWRARTSS